MDPTRISRLLEPFLDQPLTSLQLDNISTYIDLLLHWNARMNLTAERDPDAILTRHFGESFFLARHALPLLEAREGSDSPPDQAVAIPSPLRVIDIGSGPGFPGMPLKLWSPEIHLTLIESNHKKAAFLREVSRSITLTDIDVIADRAETVSGRIPAASLVTFRAVERFETILAVAPRFLSPGGRLAILIGASQLPALTVMPQVAWMLPIHLPNSTSRVLSISYPVSN